MEIAGYPHYENVCSNILKYYLDPHNETHGLGRIMLRAFLKAIDRRDINLSGRNTITVRREVTTAKGRIDLVIESNKWIIAIENKVRHFLHNDLKEYNDFLIDRYPGKEIINVVLSVRKEAGILAGQFRNLTYAAFISNIEVELSNSNVDVTSEYFIYFKQFLRTMKNLSQPMEMSKSEIDFLIQKRTEIDSLQKLEARFWEYIYHRANAVKNEVSINASIESWIYDGYDVGFTYRAGAHVYKLECFFEKTGISIVICVEPNKIDTDALNELLYFKNNNIENYKVDKNNERIVLADSMDFFTNDTEIVAKLNDILAQYKASESEV